jgi:hypothetical protein
MGLGSLKLVAFIQNIPYDQVCHSKISPKKEITGKKMSIYETKSRSKNCPNE